MKNNYKKIIRIYDKAERRLISNIDGFYYVTDGFTAVKLPEGVYKLFFQTEKPYYKDLEPGQGLIIEDVKKPAPDPVDAIKVDEFFQLREDRAPAERVGLQQEVSGGRVLDLWDIGGKLAGFNLDYIKAADAAGFYTFTGIDPIKPIHSRNEQESEVVILPVRIGSNITRTLEHALSIAPEPEEEEDDR